VNLLMGLAVLFDQLNLKRLAHRIEALGAT